MNIFNTDLNLRNLTGLQLIGLLIRGVFDYRLPPNPIPPFLTALYSCLWPI